MARARPGKGPNAGKNRAYYIANRGRLLSSAKATRAQKIAFIRGEKARRGCEFCGERDPIVLDFDHLDPSTKSRMLIDASNKTLAKFGWSNLLREIAKCRVLCANCHRRETYRQMLEGVRPAGPPTLF